MSILRAWKKGRGGRVSGTPRSRRSRRVVKVPTWVVDLLVPLLAGKSPDDLVFTAPRGGPIRPHLWLERYWPPALEAAGISKHLTIHNLRHTFASWMLMSGVAPQVVQHMLGHESLATTSTVYGHLLIDAQGAAVDAIGWTPVDVKGEIGK